MDQQFVEVILAPRVSEAAKALLAPKDTVRVLEVGDPTNPVVLDLKELKDILQREVLDRMDHRHLNYEVPELAGKIPTCENVAAAIWHLLVHKITKGKLDRVRLYESPDLFADCTSDHNGEGTTPEAGARG